MFAFFDSLGIMFSTIGSVFANLWFLILPPVFWHLFEEVWKDHVQEHYLAKLKYVLLEVIPPREIEKSPKPMESFFDALAGVDKGLTVAEEYIKGELIPGFSFEFVSDGGVVHFYIKCEKGFRNTVEATLYAHYPEVEIVEVPEDYVDQIPKGIPNKEWDLWGTDFSLNRDDFLPIRTYPFFEEDVTGKMIDPLANILEIMGRVPPGHKLWFQIITSPIRPHWYRKEGKQKLNEFLASLIKEKGGLDFGVETEEGGAQIVEKLTPAERRAVEVIEENLGKNMFRSRLRFIYLGPRKGFDKPSFVSGFIGSIKQFNDNNLNGFKPDDSSKTYANYLFTKPRKEYRQRRLLRRYKTRDPAPHSTTCLMSTAELATVIHMPDMSVVAPAMTRVSAKKGSAPANLPVGM